MSWYFRWKPYVPVAKRRANALKHAEKIAKKEKRALEPIRIDGRTIARTFWGQSWCENLEHYSDYSNRLPRGRTYVRNGSVIDLRIKRGQIDAMVSGSEIYTIKIKIDTLKPAHWDRVKKECASSISSVMQLLTGKFDEDVMTRLCHPEAGIFPKPKEISMACSCPDGAYMCKHLAAVLYGIGARLDSEPELLFTLRDVDHLELVGQAVSTDNLNAALTGDDTLAGEDLGEVFGIELSSDSPVGTVTAKPKKSEAKARAPKKLKASAIKKSAKKKPVRAGKTKN
jgi:uncharacterized Zn finger protein